MRRGAEAHLWSEGTRVWNAGQWRDKEIIGLCFKKAGTGTQANALPLLTQKSHTSISEAEVPPTGLFVVLHFPRLNPSFFLLLLLLLLLLQPFPLSLLRPSGGSKATTVAPQSVTGSQRHPGVGDSGLRKGNGGRKTEKVGLVSGKQAAGEKRRRAWKAAARSQDTPFPPTPIPPAHLLPGCLPQHLRSKLH